MSAAKAILEEVAMREFGAITEETLRLATPIAQAELRLDAEGKVVASEKPIYTLTEDDIINTAAERGITLTPEQLNEAVRYFEKGFSASCGWDVVAGMAIDELHLPEKEGNRRSGKMRKDSVVVTDEISPHTASTREHESELRSLDTLLYQSRHKRTKKGG